MTWPSLLLLFKIGLTAIAAALPMRLLSSTGLRSRLGIDANAVVYIRLYGMAGTALLVGYASGIPMPEGGSMPWGVVAMGIVSNAGAAALMLSPLARGASSWMAAVFGTIAAGLIAAAIMPSFWLAHAW